MIEGFFRYCCEIISMTLKACEFIIVSVISEEMKNNKTRGLRS